MMMKMSWWWWWWWMAARLPAWTGLCRACTGRKKGRRERQGKKKKGSERDDAAWVVMEDGKVSGRRTISAWESFGQIHRRRLLSHWEELTTYLEHEASRAPMAGACNVIGEANHQDALDIRARKLGSILCRPSEPRVCRTGCTAQRSASRYAHTH